MLDAKTYSLFEFSSFEAEVMFFQKFRKTRLLNRLFASVTNDNKVARCVISTTETGLKATYFTKTLGKSAIEKEYVVFKTIDIVDNCGVYSIIVKYPDSKELSKWFNTIDSFIDNETDYSD